MSSCSVVFRKKWIRDLVEFVQFALDPEKYNNMDTMINDVLAAHNKEGYLVAISDGSVKNLYQIRFGWVFVSAKGQYSAKSFGECDGRGNSLRLIAVGMLSISIFVALIKNTETIQI